MIARRRGKVVNVASVLGARGRAGYAAYSASKDGLLANMIAFNVGVELGQLLALAVILALMTAWRRLAGFPRQAVAANAVILAAGFILMDYQLAQFAFGGAST